VQQPGPLDELPDDLTADYMLGDDSFDSCGVDSIIQSRGPAWARQGRKACS